MSNINLPPNHSAQPLTGLKPRSQSALSGLPATEGKAAAVTPPAAPSDQLKSAPVKQGAATQSLGFLETPPPPSQEDINWALELESKVKQGYQPTPAEVKAYQEIATRLQQSQQATGVQPARGIPAPQPLNQPVSREERCWALDLEQKVKQGYQPNQAEIKSYQNIAQRLLRADHSPQDLQAVSQAEIDWAIALQQRVQQGYQATPRELEIYTDIYNRMQAAHASQKPAQPVSQAELQWASDLQQKVQQGYQPNAQEQKQYLDIYSRYQAESLANDQNNGGFEAVTQQELEQVMKLRQQAQQGYQPSSQELAEYADIVERLALQDASTILPAENMVTQHEIDWALKLGKKLQNGAAATPEELQRYQETYQRHFK